MASDQAKELLKDPSFWQQPEPQRVQKLASIDKDFAGFSSDDQLKALKLSEPKYRATVQPPEGPRKRNEGAGKPKTQETLEQGLSKEHPIMQALFTPVTGALQAGRGVSEKEALVEEFQSLIRSGAVKPQAE